MSQRIDMKHIRTALHVMAYGASDVYTKRLLTRCRKMTARQAAVAVKWQGSHSSHTDNQAR